MPKGGQVALGRKMVDRLVAKGWTREAAAGAIGNMYQENSLRGGGWGGDQGTSAGGFQWHNERGRAYMAWAQANNRDVNDPMTSVDYMDVETKSKMPGLFKRMNAGGMTAGQEAVLFGRGFERPKESSANWANRSGFASKVFGDGGGGAFAGGGGSSGGGGASGNWGVKDSSDVIDHLKEMRDKGLVTNQQCVSLATAAVGIKLGSGREGANVHDWRRGDAAQAGGLKAGTPISTFLDRQGRTTDLYAGGGSGTMGAHLDHAAIFEKYIRNKGGAITGMDVAEQYKGSGGTHSRAYMFGRGWGEGDAANYYAVKTASGGYLGGKANPMSRRNMPQSDEAPSVAVSNPLGMGNWQAAKKPSISLHNKTGSDVFINASTMSV
jgi:hypothetical protein